MITCGGPVEPLFSAVILFVSSLKEYCNYEDILNRDIWWDFTVIEEIDSLMDR